MSALLRQTRRVGHGGKGARFTPALEQPLDWGSEEAFKLSKPGTTAAALAKEGQGQPVQHGWGMRSASSSTFEEALTHLDTSSGPKAMKALVQAKDAPHPLEILDRISTRHGGTLLHDYALCILMLKCRENMVKLTDRKQKAMELTRAKSLFYKALSSKHDVGGSTNSALIMCLCEGDKMEVAELTLKKMEKFRIKPPPQAYTALISGYARRANPSEKGKMYLSSAWEHFEQMTHHASFDKTDEESVQTSLSMAASALLRGAAKAKSEKDALHVWSVVVQKWGVKPSLFMYTHYIHCLAVSGKLSDAMNAFEDMKSAGVEPNVYTYCSLMSGLGEEQEDIEYAERLFLDMKADQVHPTVALYTALLKVYQRVGDIVGMRSVYIRMRKDGLVPNAYTWQVILTALEKATRNSNDRYGKLILGLWDKVSHGLASTALRGPFPREQRESTAGGRKPNRRPHVEPPSTILLHRLLLAMTRNFEKQAVIEVSQYLEKHGKLYTKVHYNKMVESLTSVGATEECARIEAESKRKVCTDNYAHSAICIPPHLLIPQNDEYQQRMRTSTRPRDAAARSDLL